MATNREWAAGYLAQARADLAAAKAVAMPTSVFAMLLQMAFEKFAKAALPRTGAMALRPAISSHRAASTMVAVLKRQRGLIAPIGNTYLWEGALNAVEALERAHPSIAAGGPQLEYPWETTAGIAWPERDLPVAQRLRRPNSRLAVDLLQFATKLDSHFDAIFP